MNKNKSSIQKVIRRYRSIFLYLMASAAIIAILFSVTISRPYYAETDLLVKGENAEQVASSLAYLIPKSHFHDKLVNQEPEPDFTLSEKLLDEKSWAKAIQIKLKADKQILNIRVKGTDEKEITESLNHLIHTLNQNSVAYTPNNTPIDLLIINQIYSYQQNYLYKLGIWLIMSILGMFFLITGFTLYKAYLIKKKARLKYLKYQQYLRGKRSYKSRRRHQINRSKKIPSTEQEVKEKLNKLIRGEDILKSINKKSVDPKE